MSHEWQTKISRVLEGKVLIRGYSHEKLIGDYGYAEGVFLTLRGELPTRQEGRMMDALLMSLLDHGFGQSPARAGHCGGTPHGGIEHDLAAAQRRVPRQRREDDARRKPVTGGD